MCIEIPKWFLILLTILFIANTVLVIANMYLRKVKNKLEAETNKVLKEIRQRILRTQ